MKFSALVLSVLVLALAPRVALSPSKLVKQSAAQVVGGDDDDDDDDDADACRHFAS
jgi:hypothetical protein